MVAATTTTMEAVAMDGGRERALVAANSREVGATAAAAAASSRITHFSAAIGRRTVVVRAVRWRRAHALLPLCCYFSTPRHFYPFSQI